MPLVMFLDACEHCARICSSLIFGFGYAICVCVCGIDMIAGQVELPSFVRIICLDHSSVQSKCGTMRE